MSQSAGHAGVHGHRSITYNRVVDLSLGIHPGMPVWPGDPPVKFDEVARLDSDGYYLRRFAMSEHGGTHMNAPNSFHPAGASIDEYPAESLVVPASVINLEELVGDHFDYGLTTADIDRWESRHGPVPPGGPSPAKVRARSRAMDTTFLGLASMRRVSYCTSGMPLVSGPMPPVLSPEAIARSLSINWFLNDAGSCWRA
jgi:hypothetical protein